MQKSRGSFKLKRLGICLLLGGKGSYHRGLSILIESVASNLFMGIAKVFLKRSRILGTHQLTFDYQAGSWAFSAFSLYVNSKISIVFVRIACIF